MPYTNISWGQLIAQLQTRLDSTFWTPDELRRLLMESVRTFNSATRFFRNRVSFPTSASLALYNLQDHASDLDFTVTDRDLVGTIEDHLLEPYSPAVWAGSNQFNLNDLTKTLQNRRNQYMMETGILLNRSTVAVPGPPINRVSLASDVIDPRYLWFQDSSTNDYIPLRRTDIFAEDAYAPDWNQTPGDPDSYGVNFTQPITLSIMPGPNNSGTLDMLSINSPAPLDPTVGVLMNMPDDFTWGVKWGAMADLLNMDSVKRDPFRASYCEQRYQECVQLGRMASSVLASQINDRAVGMASVDELDNHNPEWRNTEGEPDTVATAGWNMVAVSTTPDGIYGVTLDIVKNAPVPSHDGEFLQLGQEEIDAVLGLAQHMASWKMGGAEFMATRPLYEQFWQVVSVYNETIRANSIFWDVLKDRAIRPKETKHYRKQKPETVRSGA